MAEHGNNGAQENGFGRALEHVRHGADRVIHFRNPRQSSAAEAAANKGDGPHVSRPSASERARGQGDRSSMEDFPYDSSREDEFTAELAAVADDDDGISSPKSQGSGHSMDTLNSSVSGLSWTSNQKTIGGLGTKEGRSQEVLGPYKRNIVERDLGGVPSDYQNYINDGRIPKSTHNDTTHSVGNFSFDRSSSTSSDRSVPDSLYADLSSISDRDLQVPEGLIKADGFDNGYDHEGRGSPNRISHTREHVSNLKLH